MQARLLRWCAVPLLMLPLALSGQADEAKVGRQRIEKLRPSIALLIGRRDGKEYPATGFVLAGADGQKVIVTTAHALPPQDTGSVSVRLPEWGGKPAVCDLIDINEGYDLAILMPRRSIKAAALLRLERTDRRPALTDPILLLGHPQGYGVTFSEGKITADTVKWKAFARKDMRRAYPSYADKLELLRHNAESTPGLSGSPVLNREDKLIGVQLGTLPQATQFGLCIDAGHLEEMNFKAKPQKFRGPYLDMNMGKALALHGSMKKKGPPILKINGTELDVSCGHYGYVTKDAETVIERYVQDKNWMKTRFTQKRLQKLLDWTPVAHLSNPTLGFRVLVPKGYLYQVDTREGPPGITLRLTHPDPRIKPPENQITIHALVDPGLLLKYRGVMEAKIREGKLKLDPVNSRVPEYVAGWKKGVILGGQMAAAEMRFIFDELKLRLMFNGKPVGNPESEVFKEAGAFSPRVNWHRANYDSTESDVCHAVHIGVQGSVIIVVHYQFNKKDRTAFYTNKPVSDSFLERMFIASSVSLY